MSIFPETPPDQVDRLQQFRIDHPDITVMPPATFGSLWSAHRDGIVLCTERELSVLLDRLEWMTGFLP